MQMRFNWLTAVLAVALLTSVTASGLLLSSNSQLSSDNSASATRLQMNSILSQGQLVAQAEIKKLDALAANLGMDLGPHGLNGTATRALMNATMAANANIISILTYNTSGIVIAAEPYTNVEGRNLSGDVIVQKLLITKMPVMSNVFKTVEGPMGAVLAAPVFDTTGRFIGGVSIVFNHNRMMESKLPQLLNGTSLTFWSMQNDGLLLYDEDPTQVGKNLLGPDYAAFPSLQALAWRMVNESSGYGIYNFAPTAQNVVNTECYWTNTGAHGVSWRLVIVHRL